LYIHHHLILRTHTVTIWIQCTKY